MATLADLSFRHRAFMRLYRYRQVDWRPSHALDKPLSAACVATITSAGYYLPGQPPFDQSADGGDCSYRVIDSQANLAALHVGNRSDAFDSSGLELDKNLALPLDRLHELAREHAICAVAPRHVSIMGRSPRQEDSCRERPPRLRPCFIRTPSTRCCSFRSDRCATSRSDWSRASSKRLAFPPCRSRCCAK